MKTKLFFEIEKKYDRTTYPVLINLALKEYWDRKKKKYIWVFPIDKIGEVCAVLAKVIEFDKKELEQAVLRCPGIKQEVKIGPTQGDGFIKIDTYPTYFLVTTVRERTIEKTKVPIETAKILWDVVSKQPLNKKILTHTVAKNFCEEMGITRFHRDSNSFDWAKYRGTRQYYLRFYATIKVLQHFGVVSHIVAASQSGIEKLKNKWEIQKVLLSELNPDIVIDL